MKIDPNNPAMPINYDNVYVPPISHMGLTIRAELAARAMQGILTHGESTSSSGSTSRSPDDIAFYSVLCADALIEELNKEN